MVSSNNDSRDVHPVMTLWKWSCCIKERAEKKGREEMANLEPFFEMGNGIERHVLYCVTSRILLQKSKCVHNIIQERGSDSSNAIFLNYAHCKV